MGSDLETIILASSVLYELLGPGCAKLALYYRNRIRQLEDVAVVVETTEAGEKVRCGAAHRAHRQKIAQALPSARTRK